MSNGVTIVLPKQLLAPWALARRHSKNRACQSNRKFFHSHRSHCAVPGILGTQSRRASPASWGMHFPDAMGLGRSLRYTQVLSLLPSLLQSQLGNAAWKQNSLSPNIFFLLSFSADLLLASHPLDRERKKTHSFLEVSHLTMCVFNSQHSSILIWSITLSSEGRQATEHLLASPR